MIYMESPIWDSKKWAGIFCILQWPKAELKFINHKFHSTMKKKGSNSRIENDTVQANINKHMLALILKQGFHSMYPTHNWVILLNRKSNQSCCLYMVDPVII